METNSIKDDGADSNVSPFINSVLAGGIGFLLGKTSSPPTRVISSPDDVIYPGYAKFLDNIIATLTQSQLISMSMAIIKCTYLRSLLHLDIDNVVQQDRRSKSHLLKCASKSLKTPFATKLVVYNIQGGLGQSLLVTDGSFATKSVKIVPEATPSILKYGVTDILSTILSSDSSQDEISFQSARRVGSHNRFNLSPKSTLFEAIAFSNKPFEDYEGLEQAISLYYAVLLGSLSPKTKSVVLSSDFVFSGFCTLNYKEDGCGFATNFRSFY